MNTPKIFYKFQTHFQIMDLITKNKIITRLFINKIKDQFKKYLKIMIKNYFLRRTMTNCPKKDTKTLKMNNNKLKIIMIL